jgi:hypothetical protein
MVPPDRGSVASGLRSPEALRSAEEIRSADGLRSAEEIRSKEGRGVGGFDESVPAANGASASASSGMDQ